MINSTFQQNPTTHAAHEAGFNAHNIPLPRSDNPYPAEDHVNRRHWYAGWDRAQRTDQQVE